MGVKLTAVWFCFAHLAKNTHDPLHPPSHFPPTTSTASSQSKQCWKNSPLIMQKERLMNPWNIWSCNLRSERKTSVMQLVFPSTTHFRLCKKKKLKQWKKQKLKKPGHRNTQKLTFPDPTHEGEWCVCYIHTSHLNAQPADATTHFPK